MAAQEEDSVEQIWLRQTIHDLRERVKRLEDREDRLKLELLAAAVVVIGALLVVALT